MQPRDLLVSANHHCLVEGGSAIDEITHFVCDGADQNDRHDA